MGGYGSIIFEINERVLEGSDDEAAVKFHLEDIIGEDAWKRWDQKRVHLPELPYVSIVNTILLFVP